MQLSFRSLMWKQSQVVGELKRMLNDDDVIIDVIREHGDLMRDSVALGYEPFAIANELASRISD